MEQARLGLEYLQAVVWPLLALGVIFIFRNEIRLLIGRLRKAGGLGFGAETWPPVDQVNVLAGQLSVTSLDAVVKEKTEIPVGGEERPAVDNEIISLRARIAESQLYLAYERMYRLAFGTQIQVLYALNATGFSGLEPSEIAPYFNEYVRLTGSPPGSMDNYVGFLTSNGLMAAGADGRYYITDTGKGFLQYLIASGISPQKHY